MPNSIEQYTRALENLQTIAQRTRQTIVDLNAQMRQPGGSSNPALLQQFQAQLAQARELVAAYRQLESERTKFVGGAGAGTGYVPGGATKGPAGSTPPVSRATEGLAGIDQVSEQFRQAVIKAKAALGKMGKDFQRVGDFSQTGEIGSARLYQDMDTKGVKVFFDKVGNFGRSLRELSRTQVLNDPQFSKLFDVARKFGFSDEDFRRMRASGTGAYQVAEFRRNKGGVDFRQEFNVDRQGAVQLAPTQRRYQSFAQTVGKDIGDLLKWSIAISAIYGPINALSEAMTELIENESKLADVSIALNDEVASANQIFDDVYESAKTAGEGVSLVIDAFGQAFRAAGRVGNEFQRYDTAVTLLNDSLILSKLSTLDEAQAIDVLTAALYQSAGSQDEASEALSRGSQLLDQWVRVSQVASVDIETLATGVAVLGDSAETAGLSLEQLNAMIATIAETSLSSGKESANIAKALIGNYQSDQAVRELNRLGIAVVDATGKNRQFLEVMQDVASLRSQGLLGNEDFSQLTLALGGGGIRRQKDVSAFIENFGRMQQITELQFGAEGEAADALSRKLDTVQTSATNLSNSFSSLAQTMGNEGGLLDVFSGALQITTKFVEVLNSLAGSIGKVSPLLLGLGVAYLAFGSKDLTSRLANNLTIPFAQRFMGGPGSIGAGIGAAQYMTGRPFGGLSGAAGRLANAPSLAAIGIPAAQNFAAGDSAEGWANIAGGALGALLGGPIGALAGAAIAEAFVRTTITYDTQFADFFSGVITSSTDKQGRSRLASGLSIPELTSEVFKSIGGGNDQAGRFLAFMENLLSKTSTSPLFEGSPLAESFPGQYKSEEAAALEILKKSNPELYSQVISRYTAEGGKPPGVELSPLGQRQKQFSEDDSAMLRAMQGGRQDELRSQLISGDVRPSEYARQIASLSAFTLTATRYMAALVDETGKLGPEFSSSEDAYTDFLAILSSGNEELISQINAQVAAIDYYQQQLDTWTPGTELKDLMTGGVFTPENRAEIEAMVELFKEALAGTTQYGAQQIRLQNLQIPEVYGGNITPTPAPDLQTVLKETLRVQERRYGDLKEDDYQALVDSFDEFAVLVEDSGQEFYEKVSGIDKSIFAEVFQQLQKEGKIRGQDGQGVGFSEIGYTAQQLKTAEAQAPDFIQKYLAPKGYKEEVSDAIYATTDEQIVKTHGDQKIIQYLLQQILDTERKQLEGIYNLPEGATAWVPLTAAWLADRPYGDGMGGSGSRLDPSVYPSSAKTPYSQIPGEELSQYNTSVKEMLDYLTSGKKGVNYVRPDDYIPGEETGFRSRKDITGTGTGSYGDIDTISSVISQLVDAIKSLGLSIPGFGGDRFQDTTKSGRMDLSPRREVLDNGSAQQLSTRLDIKLTSTTQLLVDGRVLASIIKPYLAADLLKTNESGGTITRSYVI